MSRNLSNRWLQSFLSRQKSDRASGSALHSDADNHSIDERAIDEIIVEDFQDQSSRVSPRLMTLEADRAAKIEAYRLEAQRQVEEEAKRLELQRIELQHLERLERLETQRLESQRLDAEQQDAEQQDAEQLARHTLIQQRKTQTDHGEPEAFSTQSDLKPNLNAKTRNRRDRRRQATRRARRDMPFKQRIKRSIQHALKGLIKGVIGLVITILKLVRRILITIVKASLSLCTGLYRIIVPIVKRHRWTFILGSIIAIALGTAGGALWWISQVPPAVQCDKIAAWSVDSERLYCAQVAADSGKPEDILKGITLVEDWQLGHPLYNQAQRSLQRWTEQLLIVAREKLDKQDLDGAIAIAKKIPKNSPLYAEVQQEMTGWQESRNLGQKLYETVQAALKKQSWDDASVALAKLANVNDPTWQKRLIELRKQLETEKSAGVILKQAQDFAKSHPPEQWGIAIALTDPINRKTFVWATAQKDIEQWRNQVFDLAIVRLLDQKKPAIAMALIKTIPANINLTAEQWDVVHLAQVSEIVSDSNNEPMLQQLGRIALASQLVAQIPDSSRFRARAVALLPQLETQSEDVVQLEVARSLARLGPLPFVQGAIAQAEQVLPKHPGRIQAQTLIAQWKKESQRLEDSPTLFQGDYLSKLGGVSQLKQAAGLMDRVLPGRSLHSEAQRKKGQWIAQAQTLEDKPILNQARAQAKSGDLSQAIQTAQKVGSGRALYAEAQRDIGGWADQIQSISDRALMERATVLAAKGNLTQAIDVASGVSSNAVSGEARSSISQWSAERESIRRSRAPIEPVEPRRQVADPTPPPESTPTPPPTTPDSTPPPARSESDPAPPLNPRP